MSPTTSADAVTAWIDEHKDELVEFLLEFANVPSPTGQEAAAGDFLYREMNRHFDTEKQVVVDDRANVLATLPGDSRTPGNSLIFNAHIDTAFGNREHDQWVTADDHRVYYESWQDGQYLYGDDIANDKGPLAAFLWAGRAIAACDVSLDGDLYLAGVVGEIQSAPVDEFQSPTYQGTGFGSRHLVTQGGVSADYAVVAETTDYAIGQMECGLAQFKITLTDDVEYWPRLEYPDPEDVEAEFPGALHDACRAVGELHRWAVEYSRNHVVEYDHGTNRPTAGVGAIRSAHPFSVGHAPGKAAIYVNVFLPPGKRPEFVLEELRQTVSRVSSDARVETYNAARGYIADRTAVKPLVAGIERAHERVREDSPPRPDAAVTSMWRDINVFNEVGIPAVTYGPSRSTESFSGTKHRCMHVDDLISAAKIYAQTALTVCR